MYEELTNEYKELSPYYEKIEKVINENKVLVCTVEINNLFPIIQKIIAVLRSNCWIEQLDIHDVWKESYRSRINKTSRDLVSLFQSKSLAEKLEKDIGEHIVTTVTISILCTHHSHVGYPIGELFKEKRSNNHGFDFYSIHPDRMLTFGEAKFDRHGGGMNSALKQIKEFIEDNKVVEDINSLPFLIEGDLLDKYAEKKFGFCAGSGTIEPMATKLERRLENNAHYKKLNEYNLHYLYAIEISLPETI